MVICERDKCKLINAKGKCIHIRKVENLILKGEIEKMKWVIKDDKL